jgi:glycosyltransferase involved in cell wall biosynthesis
LRELTLPRVSVVIPTYNNARYLKCAIDSVLTQTYSDYEIISVDDGSTDDTRAIVAAFGDQLRYIHQQNKGPAGARNAAILASSAEFIGLLDADDEWRPDYLQRMIALATEHPDARVFYCAARGIDAEGNDLPQLFGCIAKQDGLYRSLLRANFIIPSTVLLRRTPIVAAGPFDEQNRTLSGCEDWDLWLRLSRSERFEGTAAPLVRYRLHTNTFSARPRQMQGAAAAVMEKLFGPDDGKPQRWSEEKRRGFGGLYRFHALTSLQRQERWDVAATHVRKALSADPTLSADVALFYELLFGTQEPGYRGSAQHASFDRNATAVINLLAQVFQDASADLAALRRRTYATAHLALGLVAYNTNRRRLSRRYLLRALALWPPLLATPGVALTLLKSSLPAFVVRRFKRL